MPPPDTNAVFLNTKKSPYLKSLLCVAAMAPPRTALLYLRLTVSVKTISL